MMAAPEFYQNVEFSFRGGVPTLTVPAQTDVNLLFLVGVPFVVNTASLALFYWASLRAVRASGYSGIEQVVEEIYTRKLNTKATSLRGPTLVMIPQVEKSSVEDENVPAISTEQESSDSVLSSGYAPTVSITTMTTTSDTWDPLCAINTFTASPVPSLAPVCRDTKFDIAATIIGAGLAFLILHYCTLLIRRVW